MQPLPGFRDFYPDDFAVRRHIFDQWRETARRYGFREYDGPPLESLDLYTKKSGEEIVGQLYNFTDKGDRAIALRPEMTPTLARMIGTRHRDFKKPIKWFAIPQLFRYERQQRGRLREHFQFNADIIGENNPGADAELIALAIDSLRALGLTESDFIVRISDRQAWEQFFLKRGVVSDKLFDAFQAIDKLERETPEKTRVKLAVIGLTSNQADEAFAFASEQKPSSLQEGMATIQSVMNALGDLGNRFCVPDFRIVRGLAYYTGVVWEIHDRKGELRAIAGGGRYDRLIQNVTGVDLPAAGFGMGDVVLTKLLNDRGLLPKTEARLDCYVVITDEILRGAAMDLIRALRALGLATDYPLAAAKVGKQFELASASGARFAVVVGTEEWESGEVTLKNLATGAQERVKAELLAAKIKTSCS